MIDEADILEQDAEDTGLYDLESSGIPCPKCDIMMVVYTTGTDPDDFKTVLICPNCKYQEDE